MRGNLTASFLRMVGSKLVLAISRARVLILSREKEGFDLIRSGVMGLWMLPLCLYISVERVSRVSYFF